MARRPVDIPQTKIARVLRAAKKAGAGAVEIEGSTIRIVLAQGGNNGDSGERRAAPVAKRRRTLL